MASSSSGFPQGEKYEVFISFRGADVRYGFLSHVVAALRRKQIKAFMDDTDLQRGNEITPSLLKIIEQSKISIVIFSKDYPNSPWCLDELEKILDYKEKMKQIVVPVFYQVDPSDIQELKGNYAIAYHTQQFPASKVENWKRALVEISQLSGFDSKNSMSEASLCDDIANNVDQKLSDFLPINMHDGRLSEIDSRVEDLELLIEPEANGMRMVGIWGMGGIGKTTLADKVFNKIKNKFDGQSFVPNVREKLSKKLEIKDLRDDIIREVLRDKDIKIGSPHTIDYSIQRRLKDTKVLIVLDDVDNCQQLKSLLEDSGLCSLSMFGSGSRIIVTSRDKHVLENVNMQKHIYQAEKLSDDEALQLFSWHAFHQCYPQEGYQELSVKVVQYCHGLPLGLVVLGSELKGKRTREWEAALAKFSSIPHMDILKILRTSFDGLDPDEKSIFLDIACFFKGDFVEDVERKLDCFGFHARNGIDRLCDKSLITNYNGKIEMHDLVQQMGQNIVVEQSQQNHENKRRLWTYKDISDVLTNDGERWNHGTENVEAISLNVKEIDDYIEISSKAFLHMHKLRLLQVIDCNFDVIKLKNKVRLPEGLEFLPNCLRYLKWVYYPSSSLPSNFNPGNLVELHMPYSRLKRLIWKNLTRILDLAKAPNLEVVDLRACTSLVNIGSSIGNLIKLTTLDLQGCRRLYPLPEIPGSVEVLYLSSGIGKRQLPLPIRHHQSFWSLYFNLFPNFASHTNTICNLRSLKSLDISDCEYLNKLPKHLGNLESLEKLCVFGSGLIELPSSICNLRFLTFLNISLCKKLNKLPELLGNLQSLGTLCVSGTGLKELPSSICNLRSLTVLDVSFCKKLNKLPEHLGNLLSLEKLLADDSDLKELPFSICNLSSLTVLHISCYKKLNMLPEQLGNLKSLEHLDICGTDLEELPSSICNLRSLTVLNISCCKSLNKLPEYLGNLQSLKTLYALGSGLKELPSSMCNLRSLSHLDISDCMNLNNLPEHLGNLESLKTLAAFRSGLQELPSSIQHICKLEYLNLGECKKLESLPYLPLNLEALYAANCASLKSVSAIFKLPHAILDLSNCQKLNEGASLIAQEIPWGIKFLSADKWPCLCIVGSEVPQWMKYRNDNGSSLSLELDTHGSSIYVIFCVVVAANQCLAFSPSRLNKCAILKDECGRTRCGSSGRNDYIFHFDAYYGNKLNFEHLLLWYCRVEHNVRKASFSMSKDIEIIKCGVHPIIENQI